MEVKDLLFFNKEGYAINANYNEDLDLWSSKILFDKNSTETYKTQALYLFEKIQKTNNTFSGLLNKFQVFNTNNFHFYPKRNIDEVDITKIELVNNDVNYNTKWIYGDNIEKYFYDTSYCYFKNIDGFHNNDFDTVEPLNLYQNVRKILDVQPGRILVYTDTANDIPITNPLPATAKVRPINIIEVQQESSEPVWNQTNLNSIQIDGLYSGKKLSVVTGTNNDKVYTVKNKCEQKTKNEYILPFNLHTPSAGDVLSIELELKTSNIVISNGVTQFATPNTNQIILPYIPQFLNIGDFIIAQANIGVLSLSNQIQLEVLDIDYTTNTITVDQVLASETIDSTIYLASNVFKIEQEIVKDNNNIYSLPLTYWTIVNTFNEELLSVSGGYNLNYIDDSDELQIVSQYNYLYSNINVFVTDSSGTQTSLTPGLINNTYDIFPIYVEEDIEEQITIQKDSTLYNRSIVFTTIDSFGLNLTINGKQYNISADLTVNDTIDDWILEHQSDLDDIGIQAIKIGTDTLNISSDFPNVPIFIETNFGSQTDYVVQYKNFEFNFIKTQLLININDEEYLVPFDTDDNTTVSNWVNTYQAILEQFGIIVSNTANIIHFNLLDPEQELQITYNIGYIPKSGDLSVYETVFATNSVGSIIAGNELIVDYGQPSLLDFYAVGQKLSITGASKIPQNKSYNVLGINTQRIQLSYQGAFWREIKIKLSVRSDFFIRKPKTGITNIGNNGKLNWSFKDTKTPDFFLYDFSGDQIKTPVGFPSYNGPIPLSGPNGDIELKLNKFPNKNKNEISNPLKQQTVFDLIEYDLDFLDTTDNINIEPTPLQTFIGYNTENEGWNKSRLYLEFIEDVNYNVSTNISNDNLWVFKEDYVEIQNIVGLNFLQLGFEENQIIEFGFSDVTDGKDLAKLDNSGIQYRIKEVLPKKIIFTTNVIEETSIKEVPSSTLPYYTSNGDPIFETRYLNVSMNVMPRVIAYFDIFGESEAEDERHKISLNNKNLNILKLSDFFIFKKVDIKEEGVDWIYMNRKRKELLEIYPEISNYLGSYKSIIKAINFFGYNDLTFTEYFQNINPDSDKFGKLFNLELLNIFDKSTKGWKFSNLNYENMRSLGYKKTNLFSLNYAITDKDGNFIQSYSQDEVKIKLLGLKRWLTDNLLPIGTKILDINGKYVDQNNLTFKHETYINKRYNVEEYASPIDFKVEGYKLPVSNGSNMYDIAVDFFSFKPIEWFQYTIKTFYIDEWNDNTTYLTGDVVLFNKVFYKAINNIPTGLQPDLVADWQETNLENIQYVQILQDYKTGSNTNTSFTVNKTIDPHFLIETSWHSGYANSYKIKKTYSVIDGFFDEI